MIADEKMEAVTGGSWRHSVVNYRSGKTPRYSVGQVVGEYYCIKPINKGKRGFINREFTYVVVYSYARSEVHDSNMYESELMIAEGYWG